MAIKWIDFMQNTEGDGTYTSPYSGQNRLSLTDGDEIRVKSVSKDSIFEADWEYSIYYSNEKASSYLLSDSNISFSNQYVYYIVELDYYFMMSDTSSSNYSDSNVGKTLYHWTMQHMIPFPTDVLTTLDFKEYTIKKVSSTYNRKSKNSQYLRISADSLTNNITVTDGWTNETTRVTDGSVITVGQASYSSDGYFEIYNFENSTVDLKQFLMMPYYSSRRMTWIINNFNNNTLDLKNIYTAQSYTVLTIHETNFSTINIETATIGIQTSDSSSYAILQLNHNSDRTNQTKLSFDRISSQCLNFSTYCGYDTATVTFKDIWANTLVQNSVIGLMYSSLKQTLKFMGKLVIGYPNIASNSSIFIGDKYSKYKAIKELGENFEFFARNGYNTKYVDTYLQDTIPIRKISIGSKYGSDTIDFNNLSSFIKNNNYPKSFVIPTSLNVLCKSNIPSNDEAQIIEYPGIINLKNINKDDITLLYPSTDSGSTRYNMPIINFITNNESFKYLNVSEGQSSDNITYDYARIKLSNNKLIYKVNSPSIMIAGENSRPISSIREYTNKWLMPVEKDIEYKLDYSFLVEDQLPNLTKNKDYTFVLKYDFGTEVTKVITASCVDAWEDFSITFTPTLTQVITFQIFITPKEDTILKAYISDLKIEPTA
jgi:hypothetical protein